MAWTLQLLNDDTTIDLNDGTNYSAMGFMAPVPPRRLASGGKNMFRHGSDIQERVFQNRRVAVSIRINGTSQDNLISNINAVSSLIERAADYSTSGIGSRVKLRRKWNNATNQVDFFVLEGSLRIADEFATIHQVNNTVIATLELICEPFAYGAEESIENYVGNPGFELATALAGWTQNHTGSGTSAKDTSVKKDGNASLKLVMTSSDDGQIIERTQGLADVDAGEVWSFQCWVRVDALSNCKFVMGLDYNTGTDVEVPFTTVNASEFVKLTANNVTVPGSVTSMTLRLRLEATDDSATGTVYIDDVIAILGSAVPSAWASSHSLGNHNDESVQAHSNYIDIHDVPGDVPALLQVKVAEGQNHQYFWAGARHAGRQYDSLILEGEDGTGNAIAHSEANVIETAGNTVSSSALSGGSTRSSRLAVVTGATSVDADTNFRHEFTMATPPRGTFRVLVAAGGKNGAGDSSTTSFTKANFEWGMSYTYGGFTLLDDTSPDVTSFVGLTDASLGENVTAEWEILDLGTITIPPVASPDNQTEAALVLKIFNHWKTTTTLTVGQEVDWYTDFVMLMPIDFGSNFVSKAATGSDTILLDSMSDVKGLYFLDGSSVVQSFPNNQLGRSAEAHPDGTRVYVLASEIGAVASGLEYTAADTFTVSVTYRPRFLHVMGA